MVRPSLEEVRSLGGFTHIPVSLEINGDLETPIRLIKKLKKRSSHCFLLESVEGGEKWGRYTFLGCDPCMTAEVRGGITTVIKNDGSREQIAGRPMDALRSLLKRFQTPHFDYLPRFVGGAVGFFGYDMVRYVENLPGPGEDDGAYPDCSLMIADQLIAFDNVRQKMILIVNMTTQGDLMANYEKAVGRIQELYRVIRSSEPTQEEEVFEKPEWSSNLKKEEYERIVEKAKEHIRDGDIFQVVLSQRFSAKLHGSLLNIYRVLRANNPSPYMYYLKLGDIEIAGASPETLLRLENGVLETCPIAGSRPRGKTPEEDEQLGEELLADEKELAEHNMLVDLGRNDIGRVSRFGSVNVREYCRAMRYSQIMHLTSLVSGSLRDDLDAFDALASILPAGTLSGAPKVKAMELIDRYERLRRGPYGGAIGYIGFDGNMDVCIAIRTVVKKGDTAFVQAGAGIVADSVPEREYYETVNKAKALFLAAEQVGSIL